MCATNEQSRLPFPVGATLPPKSGMAPVNETPSCDNRHNAQLTADGNNTYQQPPPATNGAHSKALTRLQTGYLRAISALEARNKALEQDLAITRAAEGYRNVQGQKEAAQRIAQLEERNASLQQELKFERQRPTAVQQDGPRIHQLNSQLALKNQKIKEKNTEFIQKDQTIRELQKELKQERKKQAVPNPSNKHVANLQTQLDRLNDTVTAKSNQVLHYLQENTRLKHELAEERRGRGTTGQSVSQGMRNGNGFQRDVLHSRNSSMGIGAPHVMASANGYRGAGSSYEDNSSIGRGASQGMSSANNFQGLGSNSSHASYAHASYKKRKFVAALGSHDNPWEL